MDDEDVLEMSIDDYLKGIDYKTPSNKNFKDKSKKLKQLYYNKWQGVEDVLQTITYLYRRQDTSFIFNISMAYLLKRPIWTKEDEKGQKKQIGYEYKYFSDQYNSRLCEYPKTIDNNQTLNEVLTTANLFVNFL
jgi:hypothetical protein